MTDATQTGTSRVRTAIVVPVHNAHDYVESIKEQLMSVEDPVVWVDDASDEETSTLIYDEPYYIRNERQQLFSRTSNRGIRFAYRLFDPEFIALVNTDCELREGWLETLKQIMARDERIGLVGYDNECEHQDDEFRELDDSEYVTGHCILLRVAMLKEIGVFCETDTNGTHLSHTRDLWGLAHVGSDEFMSMRARDHGWAIGYCARDLVGHAVSASWPGKCEWLSKFKLEPLWPANDRL